MNTRLVVAAAVVVFSVAAPVSSAMAFSYPAPVERFVPASPYDDLTTGSVGLGYAAPRAGWCVPSSASEGNANQQARPVKQYGQTTGGSAC